MSAYLKEQATELRYGIESDPAESTRRLIEFANDYAITAKLRYKALVYKISYDRSPTATAKDRVAKMMLELVDEVVADHEALVDSEAARVERDQLSELYARLRDRIPPQPVVFESEGLGKTFRRSGFRLKGVDLTLRQGEITGVVGENGNGKTTLFRLVAGELRHDHGVLRYPLIMGGSPRIDWMKVYRHLAYVPQELPHWYGSLENNLRYEAAIHGITGDDNDREVTYIIERLGLREHLGKRWTELSGGFKLRFALAKALVWKPKLLLLDEPLANLDFKAQQTILMDIQDLSSSLRYPMAVLLSSQHLHEVEAVSTHILFLQTGTVEYYGPVADIGSARKVNTFELSCPCELSSLRHVLTGPGYREIYDNGICYILITSLDITGPDVLQTMLKASVPVHYFRDISTSIKQLFH